MSNRGTGLSLSATSRNPTTQWYLAALVTAIAAITVGLSGPPFVALVFGCGTVFFLGSAIAIGLRRAARVIDRADTMLDERRPADRHSHDPSLRG